MAKERERASRRWALSPREGVQGKSEPRLIKQPILFIKEPPPLVGCRNQLSNTWALLQNTDRLDVPTPPTPISKLLASFWIAATPKTKHNRKHTSTNIEIGEGPISTKTYRRKTTSIFLLLAKCCLIYSVNSKDGPFTPQGLPQENYRHVWGTLPPPGVQLPTAGAAEMRRIVDSLF